MSTIGASSAKWSVGEDMTTFVDMLAAVVFGVLLVSLLIALKILFW